MPSQCGCVVVLILSSGMPYRAHQCRRRYPGPCSEVGHVAPVLSRSLLAWHSAYDSQSEKSLRCILFPARALPRVCGAYLAQAERFWVKISGVSIWNWNNPLGGAIKCRLWAGISPHHLGEVSLFWTNVFPAAPESSKVPPCS